MKIFNQDGKVNFVDKNNVVVGFDITDQCCEHFGYLICENLPDLNLNIENYKSLEIDLEPYDFLPHMCESLRKETLYGDEENWEIFHLKHDANLIYLILYNMSNGYYLHGFEMKVDGEIHKEGHL